MEIRSLSLAVLCALAPFSSAQDLPPDFHESIVWDDLVGPTAVRFAPNGQVFVAEKSGVVKVFDDVEDSSATVFADLSAEVYDTWDRGLLGLAIHPEYPAQPYVYVLYTYDHLGIESSCTDLTGAGCPARGRLSLLEADLDGGPVMLGEELVLIEDWCQQYPSHSVGDLVFGRDGALYVSAGDGANFGRVDTGGLGADPCQDPDQEGGALRSQDLRTPGDPTSLDGTLLRVDPLTGDALPDNPLYGGDVLDDDRIVAYGLRNPYRIAARPGTPELWLGDVGWTLWEEIDRVRDPLDAEVENFGWPCYEGFERQDGYDAADVPLCEQLYAQGQAAVTAPFYQYVHAGPASISGLAFYDGANFPQAYRGALFFGDYALRGIRVMHLGPDGEPDRRSLSVFRTNGRPVDLQVGPDGSLYAVYFLGNQVRRIYYYRENQPPIAQAQADVSFGASPLTVNFDSEGSGDKMSLPVEFAWDLDGDGEFDDSDQPSTSATYDTPGGREVKLRVTDQEGLFAIAEVPIAVDNTPPRPAVLAPDPDHRWRVGEVLSFLGRAGDAQSGPLPADDFSWEIVMVQCDPEDEQNCVEHPIAKVFGEASGEFATLDTPYPSHLELRLEAIDGGIRGWWDADWKRRRKLQIDNSRAGEDLFDLPLLIRLDSNRIEYGRTAPDAADLRFVSADGSQRLPHEVERWDPDGTSIVWVRVPQLAARSSTEFLWMYYDNPGATQVSANADVWDEHFAAVWHLGDELSDSTVFANHGSNRGTARVPGALGRARAFDGIDDSIDFGSGPGLAIEGDLTLEAWLMLDQGGQDVSESLLSKKATAHGDTGYDLHVQPLEDSLSTRASGSLAARAVGVSLEIGSWHHLAARHQDDRAQLFLNGVEVTSEDLVLPALPGSESLYLGSQGGADHFFAGRLDEVRVSQVARSRDWILAQYRSSLDRMVSYGSPQSPGRLAGHTTLVLEPEAQTIPFVSFPAGLSLTVNDRTRSAPFDVQAIVDGSLSVSAPLFQFHQGRLYKFNRWSDGGDRSHTVVAGAGHGPLIAHYTSLFVNSPR